MNPVPVKKMTVEFHPLDAENRKEGDIIAILGADNHPPRFGTFAAYIPKANEFCRAYVMEEGGGTPIPCSADGRSIPAMPPDVFWVPQITIAEPARPTEESVSRSHLGIPHGELVTSGFLADWLVIEPYQDGQPEGTAAEWREIIEAMEKGSNLAFKRCGVRFYGDGNAVLYSPRNSREGSASACIPGPHRDSWIARARETLRKYEAGKSR